MKKVVLLILVVIVTSCGRSDYDRRSQSPTVVDHFNIVIVPDLSNRLDDNRHPRPLKDERIVGSIVRMIPEILNHKRTNGQRDKFSVSFTNSKAINDYNIDVNALRLDFGNFRGQLQRIDYIKGRGDTTFQRDTLRFLNAFRQLIHRAMMNPVGADIWSFLQGIDDTMVEYRRDTTSFSNEFYVNKFRNVVILLTDGFIEAELYGQKGCLSGDGKRCYYLSSSLIKQFRNALGNAGQSELEVFFENSGYGLVPVKNEILRDVEILVLEMNDRSVSEGGNASVHPTDLEILKLFWKDWLTKSGVKRFEMRSVMRSEQEVKQVVKGFLGMD